MIAETPHESTHQPGILQDYKQHWLHELNFYTAHTSIITVASLWSNHLLSWVISTQCHARTSTLLERNWLCLSTGCRPATKQTVVMQDKPARKQTILQPDINIWGAIKAHLVLFPGLNMNSRYQALFSDFSNRPGNEAKAQWACITTIQNVTQLTVCGLPLAGFVLASSVLGRDKTMLKLQTCKNGWSDFYYMYADSEAVLETTRLAHAYTLVNRHL